jgi:hypothetical protein
VSNTLAISAVTATLRDLLTQGVHRDSELSGAEVTAAPVHKAPKDEAKNQINLFLYQTTPNGGWSNGDPPTARPGEEARPPLALDLHYLLTVYGADGDEVLAHRLLGSAMRVLHDHPVLGRQEIAAALTGNDLGDQVERIRITPASLSLDEMSKLWNAFQKEYRMSTAYDVSVVLIDSARGQAAALPVLKRGDDDHGVALVPEPTPPFPTLTRAVPPKQRESAMLGDVVVLHGHHLDGAEWVQASSERLTEPLALATLAGGTDRELRVRLPDDPDALPAGLYALSAIVTAPDDDILTTNEIPLAVAPELLGIAPSPAARDNAGTVTLTATARPTVLPRQAASLLLGGREVRAEPHAAPTGTLTFVVRLASAGQHWLRLRVDGVDSPLVDRTVSPPVFDPSQRITIT